MYIKNDHMVNWNLLKNNNIKDTIPEWMDNNLFDTLQKKSDRTYEAGLVLNKKQDPTCVKCGKTLARNEVAYCSQCCKDIL